MSTIPTRAHDKEIVILNPQLVAKVWILEDHCVARVMHGDTEYIAATPGGYNEEELQRIFAETFTERHVAS